MVGYKNNKQAWILVFNQKLKEKKIQENQMKYKQRTLYIYMYTHTHILVYANTIQILDEINKFLRKYK